MLQECPLKIQTFSYHQMLQIKAVKMLSYRRGTVQARCQSKFYPLLHNSAYEKCRLQKAGNRQKTLKVTEAHWNAICWSCTAVDCWHIVHCMTIYVSSIAKPFVCYTWHHRTDQRLATEWSRFGTDFNINQSMGTKPLGMPGIIRCLSQARINW